MTSRLAVCGIAVAALASQTGCNTFAPQVAPDPSPSSFVNFESPHVSPLDMTPDGRLLLAVNTPDNRLELFDLSGAMPTAVGSVPVGLDPVTVRVRDNGQAWVVNSISDSISIVDLKTRSVVWTLATGDEPADVAFSGDKAFVTCAPENRIQVFDVGDLSAPPQSIDIAGVEPRALALSPDGSKIYAAIFNAGNGTTVVEDKLVSRKDSPYGGANPPPNAGTDFYPPLNPALPAPPRVALILRKDPLGNWLDDNGQAWPKSIITWDLASHNLAIIDAKSLKVDYVSGLMNIGMQLTVRPDGKIVVIGTDATNQIRFEPNVTGQFVHSMMSVVDLDSATTNQTFDLNPHLASAYANHTGTVDASVRALSIADPRGAAWSLDGMTGYITGMGSNNVVLVGPAGERLGRIDVGQGPTGLRLDESRSRLYVLNKFEGSISVVDTSAKAELARIQMFDPTPSRIRAGRPMLYDAHLTSGLGVTACAACHVDARMDRLAWDLGNPAGDMKALNQECESLNGFITAKCGDFHPMKGPMTTQTLQSIIGLEPFHWRGDREDLGAFDPAFVSLLGNDRQMTPDEMNSFTDLLRSIRFPPNPLRNLDGTLQAQLPQFNGSPTNGEKLYHTAMNDQGLVNCVQCHLENTGTDQRIVPAATLTVTEAIKVPQLRNMYKKQGFDRNSQSSLAGFGYLHDGRFGNLPDLLHLKPFKFSAGDAGEQERRDIATYLLSFATETPPLVGKQITLDGSNNDAPETAALLALMRKMADDGQVGLVVRGMHGGLLRGYAYIGDGTFQSDRAIEQMTFDKLVAAADQGSELTWTVVPLGSQTRIGIDRDSDGRLDRDELDAGTDPAVADPPTSLTVLGL